MTQVQVFNGLEVHENNGEIMFDAEKVALGLGITQSKNGIVYVRWETISKYLSQKVGKGDFITERQFYKLAIKANNAIAEIFQDWVTGEVLPAIRKTGSYQVPMTDEERLALLARTNIATNKKVDQIAKRMTSFEENQQISQGDYSFLTKRINKRVYEVARALNINDTQQRSLLFADINRGAKEITGASSRSQIRQKDFEKVSGYINDWEPTTATKTIIKGMNNDK